MTTVLCLVTQPCLTLRSLMNCSTPGPSVHGILQARILDWVTISPPGNFTDPGVEPIALAGRFFTTAPSSVQFSSVMSSSLQPHGPKHARPPCPSPTSGVFPNSCPLSRCCHLTISSSIVPFSSCLQSFPASGSFPLSQFFASGGQSIGVSASTLILPMNAQN